MKQHKRNYDEQLCTKYTKVLRSVHTTRNTAKITMRS